MTLEIINNGSFEGDTNAESVYQSFEKSKNNFSDLQSQILTYADGGGKTYETISEAMAVTPLPEDNTPFTVLDTKYIYLSSESGGYLEIPKELGDVIETNTDKPVSGANVAKAINSGIFTNNLNPLSNNISVSGYFLRTTGSTTAHTGAIGYTSKIPCKEGDLFLYTGEFGQYAVACNFYDSDDNVIKSYAYTHALISVVNSLIIAPENSSYSIFSSTSDVLDVKKINEDSNNDFLLNQRDVKYINNNVTISDFFQKTTEGFQDYVGSKTYQPYLHKEGNTYLYSGSYGAVSVACKFYTKEGVLISNIENTSSILEVASLEITPPENTYLIIFSSLKEDTLIEVISQNENNILSPSNSYISVSGYFLRTTGSTTAHTGAIGYTSKIPCTSEDVILYTGEFGQYAVACNFYDSDDNVIKSYSNPSELISANGMALIPETGTSYAILSSTSSVLKYSLYKNSDNFLRANIDTDFIGKKLVVQGDSMAHGHTLPLDEVWSFILANKLNMDYLNLGSNGSSVSTATHGFLTDRIDDIPLDTDYLLIACLTNDIANNAPLGDENSVDVSTVNGALNVYLEGVISRIPKAKIGWISPYNRENTNSEIYVEALIKRCNAFGIRVFDNIKNGGLDWSNTAQVLELTLNDGYHLNAEGQKRAVSKYEYFMKSL